MCPRGEEGGQREVGGPFRPEKGVVGLPSVVPGLGGAKPLEVSLWEHGISTNKGTGR